MLGPPQWCFRHAAMITNSQVSPLLASGMLANAVVQSFEFSEAVKRETAAAVRENRYPNLDKLLAERCQLCCRVGDAEIIRITLALRRTSARNVSA